jgi:hypothetical protein
LKLQVIFDVAGNNMAARKLKRNQNSLVKKSPGGTSSRNHEALDTYPRMSYGSCSKQIEKPGCPPSSPLLETKQARAYNSRSAQENQNGWVLNLLHYWGSLHLKAQCSHGQQEFKALIFMTLMSIALRTKVMVNQ